MSWLIRAMFFPDESGVTGRYHMVAQHDDKIIIAPRDFESAEDAQADDDSDMFIANATGTKSRKQAAAEQAEYEAKHRKLMDEVAASQEADREGHP